MMKETISPHEAHRERGNCCNPDNYVLTEIERERETSLAVERQAAEMRAVVKTASKLFDKIDANHSGSLSMAELNQARQDKTLTAEEKKALVALINLQEQEFYRKHLKLSSDLPHSVYDKEEVVTKKDLQSLGQQIDNAQTSNRANDRAKWLSKDIISKFGDGKQLTFDDIESALTDKSAASPLESKVLAALKEGMDPEKPLTAAGIDSQISRWADYHRTMLAVLADNLLPQAGVPLALTSDNPQIPPEKPHTGPHVPTSLERAAAQATSPCQQQPNQSPLIFLNFPPLWTLPGNLPDHTYVHKPLVPTLKN